jgi:sarcosine oxidase subunit gamma
MAELSIVGAVNLPPGRCGRGGGQPGVALKVLSSRALVSVIARRNSADALTTAIKRAFDADLPRTPRLVPGRKVSFLWCGHHHWFAQGDDTANLLRRLVPEIGGLAVLSDQSDSRLIVEVSGPSVRATLAKLVPIDLHPKAFHTGDTAVTLLGYLGTQITLVDDSPIYELMVLRSFADSFCQTLVTAAAEFGIEVLPR